ncbi:MAG: roadblock/LC7 domain-containing protein [candidate division Zixibacteria bacterium]|nr:roadblock/LC7 domain-containing protein [candidate division Zixibacteria bacterium]
MAQGTTVVYWEDTARIDAVMTKLLKGSEAKCALLVDKDGHLISRHGFTQTLDTTALAALMAGSFASTAEIARLVGESEFSVLFHQGVNDHIHMNLVGDRSILAVIFDDRTTIGMVRLYARETTEQLQQIFETSADREGGEERRLSEDFTNSVEDKLDDLLRD